MIEAEAAPTSRPPFWRSLYAQVLVAIALGVLLGWLAPDVGARLEPLGNAFVNLVKMIIAPVIFLTVVTGIARIGDMRKLGRVGLKALVYFEVVTTVALLVGLSITC